jgi:hypothetical protein
MKTVPVIALLALFILCILCQPAFAETGVVTGVVSTGDNVGISGAIVSLYNINASVGNLQLVYVANNPQYTTASGVYSFFDVPYGKYYVKAIMGTGTSYAIAEVGGGTKTVNIVLSYKPVVPTPPPARYTYVPVYVNNSTRGISQSPGFGIEAAALALFLLIVIKRRYY